MRKAFGLAYGLAFGTLTFGSFAWAYCPCYTASSSNNTGNCGVEAVAGTNPSIGEWNTIFDLVSQGPSVWGNQGPSVSDIGQGCGKPEPNHPVPARFPCELLKGIAKVETGWRQFCVPDLPSDQVGGPSRTIISFDCGYGIGQVTSGMHAGENPSFDRQRVAADPTYNLATGTRILASKWIATNCVGDNQPTVVEHWYTATWAYNGLAYVNNPNNPNYDGNRGVWNPAVGGGAPYQEKVFGFMEYPNGQWEAVALAYPNRGDIGGSSSPPNLPEPNCSSPTNCTATRQTHVTQCEPTMGSSSSSSSSSSSGSGGSGGHGGMAGVGGNGTGGEASGGFGGKGTGGFGGAVSSVGTGGAGGESGGPAGDIHGVLACSCDMNARTENRISWFLFAIVGFAVLLLRRGRLSPNNRALL